MVVDEQPRTATPDRPARPPRRRRRRVLAAVALVIVLLAVAPGISYYQALTAPGSAPVGMRTVDWIRAHHGGGIVNAIENWYYTRHQPSAGPPDPATLPQFRQLPGPKPARGAAPQALPRLPDVNPLPGEATWVPGRLGDNGRPLIYTGFLRPDPRHLSLVAGVAWMRAGTSVAHLVAGTRQPGGSGWPGNAAIPAGDVAGLIATFNSGFKMADITGGFYLAGKTARPLRDGQASLVIDRKGQATVGQWGRDVSMTQNVVAVRQNLALVVDGGAPVAGLAGNAGGRWGTPRNQFQFTWRSGLGVDAKGNLVYVAGNTMNLTTLATAMVDAGIVRGMQLDIHTGMASFSSWQANSGGQSLPSKLLPGMTRSAYRYLIADQRDFIYLTAR